MPQVHRKKCSRCKAVFESAGNKGCSCGNPDFKFTDEPLTRMKVDGIPVTIKRCACSFCPPDPDDLAFKRRMEYVSRRLPNEKSTAAPQVAEKADPSVIF